MEYFTNLMDDACLNKKFQPATTTRPIVTNLVYVDDLIIFGRSNIQNATTINEALYLLNLHTGLSINVLISTVYCSSNALHKHE